VADTIVEARAYSANAGSRAQDSEDGELEGRELHLETDKC
jgi:hypothetical protein